MLDNSLSVKLSNPNNQTGNTNVYPNQDKFIEIDGHIFNIKDIIHVEKIENELGYGFEYYILVQAKILHEMQRYVLYKTIVNKNGRAINFGYMDLDTFNIKWKNLVSKLCQGE